MSRHPWFLVVDYVRPALRVRALVAILALVAPLPVQGQGVLIRPEPGFVGTPRLSESLVQRIYESARLASVRIETGSGGVGSGFFVGPGLVMTAHHVVEGADGLTVVAWDGRRLSASVVGYDEFDDVAIVAVEAPDLPFLPVDFVDSPRLGEALVAIGNSRGDFIAPRVGRVVGVERDVAPYLPARLIVSDLPLAPGDSGGPVLNVAGEVVGVAVAIGTGPRGFSSLVSPLYGELGRSSYDELIAGERRNIPFLGIVWSELDPELALRAGVEPDQGILITRVLPDTAADAAGLLGSSVQRRQVLRDGRPVFETISSGGDVITHVDGVRIRGALDFVREMRSKEVGDRVVLTVDRLGEVLELEAVLGVRPM